MGCVVFAHPAVILTEDDIKHPMQAVLDAPVTACCFGEGFGAGNALAADVEGPLVRCLAVDFPLPFDHADTGELGPMLPQWLVQPRQIGDPQRLAGFNTAMILFDGLVSADWQAAKASGLPLGEEFPQGIGQCFLVVFDGQEIVSASVENFLGDLGLTADGVNRDNAPLERQRIEQCLDGGNFVALAAGMLLRQAQATGRGVGADRVQCRVVTRYRQPSSVHR